jgi:hypothetical protein
MTLDPTSVDLLTLSKRLAQTLGTATITAGNLEGKTVLRDATMTLLSCSALEAEKLVDTLVARGFARYSATDGWQLRTTKP